MAAYIFLEWASFIHVTGMVVTGALVLQNDVDWLINSGVAAIAGLSCASVAAPAQRTFGSASGYSIFATF